MKILFFFLLLCGVADAAIIYVDKDNSCNGAGTTSDPYCSIQLAFNNVARGDTIRIRDAASPYDENAVLTTANSGTTRITIEPDVGHSPTIRYTGSGAQTGAIEVSNVGYVTIQNLTFDGSGVYTSRFGIYIHASTTDVNNVEVLNNTMRNWGGSAANANGSSERGVIGLSGGFCNPCSPVRQVRDTVIRGNTISDSRQAAIFIQHSSDTLIENNTITGMKCGRDSDQGVQTLGIYTSDDTSGGDGGSGGTIIRGNTIRDFELRTSNGSCGITNTNPAVFYDTEAGVWCDVGHANGLAEKNKIYNISYSAGQPQDYDRGHFESQGIFIEAGCYGWTVQNNVIYNIGGAGIRHRSRSSAAFNNYYHNTIFQIGYNGLEFGNVTGSGGTGDARVKNNIVMNALEFQILFDDPTGNTFDINNNLYFANNGGGVGNWGGSGTASFAAWKSACSCDANAVNADPKFVGPVP